MSVSNHNYESEFNGEDGIQDKKAKEALSNYAYDQLYLKGFRKSKFYEHKLDGDGITHIFWPTSEPCNGQNITKFKNGDRCKCQVRIDYDHQCHHEIKLYGEFKVVNWNERFLNRWKWNELHPNTLLFNNQTMTNTSDPIIPSVFVNDDEFINIDGDSNDPIDVDTIKDSTVQVSNSNISREDQRITYNELIQIFSDIARSVTNNQNESMKVFSYCKEWSRHIRGQYEFDVKFHVTDTTHVLDSNMNLNLPQPAIVSPAGPKKRCKRLKSSREIRRNTKKNKSKAQSNIDFSVGKLDPTHDDYIVAAGANLTQNSSSATIDNDNLFISATSSDKRCCALCNKSGHRRFKCPVLTKYGAALLPQGSFEVRFDLSSKIGSTMDMSISHRREEDNRKVLCEIPRSMMALIIHKKYYIESIYSQTLDIKNICVECTWIMDGGHEHPTYKKCCLMRTVYRHTLLGQRATLLFLNSNSSIFKKVFYVKYSLLRQATTMSQVNMQPFWLHNSNII